MRTGCHARIAAVLLGCLFALASIAFASGPTSKKDAAKESTTGAVVGAENADSMRLQGEQRFRANCGRCHASPEKFPPKVMKTVVRHMRVRAMITDEDMRMILFYMTQ